MTSDNLRMGIEDRDYTRDSDYTGALTGWGLDYISPMVKWIIAINVAVFVLQIFVTREATTADVQAQIQRLPKEYREMGEKSRRDRQSDEGLEELPLESYGFESRISIINEWLELETPKVLRGQVWRVLTYAFCHDRMALWHILLNMLVLYWCGVTLESMYGPREFLLFYLTGAILSGGTQIALDLYTGSAVPVVGASGAVMAAAMLYAIHYPRNTIRLFWFWPVEVRWVVLLYVVYNVHPLLLSLAGTQVHTGSAHAAHLGGLAYGFLYWKFGWRLEWLWDRMPKWRERSWSTARRRSPTRVGGERDFEAQVDDVLKKISVSGEASLTDQERRVLQLASQRYKQKHG
jgi:membrane associated rhomboid family serine protease